MKYLLSLLMAIILVTAVSAQNVTLGLDYSQEGGTYRSIGVRVGDAPASNSVGKYLFARKAFLSNSFVKVDKNAVGLGTFVNIESLLILNVGLGVVTNNVNVQGSSNTWNNFEDGYEVDFGWEAGALYPVSNRFYAGINVSNSNASVIAVGFTYIFKRKGFWKSPKSLDILE